jgi:glycosyltransferase involved in cell wall biosynthesis
MPATLGGGFEFNPNLKQFRDGLTEMNKPEYPIQSKEIKNNSTAVVLHLFYTELFDEIRANLDFLGDKFDLYVSVPEEKESFVETIRRYYPDAQILKVENRGRDLAPFLEFLKIILPLEYDNLLKIHTKETVHRPDGISWRKDVFKKLLGSENQIEIIKSNFSSNSSIAMIGPKDHVLDSLYYNGSNHDKIQSLLYKAGFPQSVPESFHFVASTMFWAKPEVFKPLLKMRIETSSFESEPLPIDGGLPHALERFMGLLVEIQGREIKSVDQNGIISTPDPYKIYPFATPPAHLRLLELKSIVFYSAYDEAYAIEHLRITAPFSAAGIEIINGVQNGIVDPDLAANGDAVIFQREFPKNVLLYDQIIANARTAGKFIFYELDDLLFHLPENHPERKQELYNDALLPMITAIADADLILVPTGELRRIAESFNPNVIVLPNYLDDTLWHLKAPKDSLNDQFVKIGYMGSNSHTPDLALIAPVIKEIVQKYTPKVQVDIWGTPLPEELTGVEGVNWYPSPTNVYKDFVNFFQSLEFDIAITPLADNLFNRCKSGLKFLEYSANGAPGVYSRVAPYESIVEDGVNGFLAGNEEEWSTSLAKLIEDATLRKKMVEAAQKEIRENWLLSKNIRSWEDIFKKLTKAVYFEDLSKFTRSNILNHINRQLYFDRVNAETRSQKQEEEFSTRFRELEAVYQKDIGKPVGKFEKQFEQSDERIRKLQENNNSLNEQLTYWSDEVHEKTAEIQYLQNRLHVYERTLNEIYQSRSWKVLTSYKSSVNKIKNASRKVLDIAAPVEQIIPGRFAKRKQTIIDSGLFDPDYYLSKYPDVKNAGVDPLMHFLNFGGLEGRDPSPEFDSSWYLENNADVKSARMNPLLHFLLYGKAEGRAYQPVIGKANALIPAVPSAPGIISTQKQVPDVIILAPKIKEILEKNLRENYLLSLSHDDYLSVTGGAQVYIAGEQRLANQKDQSYIHVYPYKKGKTLVSVDNILYLGVNLDGRKLFETESNELISALSEINDRKLGRLSIHHSMGFNSSTLQSFLDLAGRQGVFWLHDYFSLCPSYNLLRNDREYCGAPDINSNSCRLCSYGNQRKIQAVEFEQLFRANQLEVVAPSKFTYELWQSRFPVISTPHIIPPAVLRWGRNAPVKIKEGPLRIGFLGYPLEHKGWPTWLRLVKEFSGKAKFKFFHFSSQKGEPGNYTRIDTRVTQENRLAMVDSLRWNQIDVAFLWSTVAETFSFTLHEALAAGCFIVTNPNSGNIQDFIRRNPERGLILNDVNELIDCFGNGILATKVMDYQKQGKPQAVLTFGSLEEIN